MVHRLLLFPLAILTLPLAGEPVALRVSPATPPPPSLPAKPAAEGPPRPPPRKSWRISTAKTPHDSRSSSTKRASAPA